MPCRSSQGKNETHPSGNDSSSDGTGELLVCREGQVHGIACGGRSDTSAGKLSLARAMELWVKSPDDSSRTGGGCPSLEGRIAYGHVGVAEPLEGETGGESPSSRAQRRRVMYVE